MRRFSTFLLPLLLLLAAPALTSCDDPRLAGNQLARKACNCTKASDFEEVKSCLKMVGIGYTALALEYKEDQTKKQLFNTAIKDGMTQCGREKLVATLAQFTQPAAQGLTEAVSLLELGLNMGQQEAQRVVNEVVAP